MVLRYCHSSDNHEWAVKIQTPIVYLCFKFDEIQNDYSTETLVFLEGDELKKNSCLRRLN